MKKGVNLYSLSFFMLIVFDGGLAGFKDFKFTIPILIFFLIPYLWPVIIIFDYIIHWIAFNILIKILGISKKTISNINRIIFKSAIFGFLFDLLTVIVMFVLSIIIEKLFGINKNFTYAVSYNVFKSIPALLIMLFSMFINRCCFYLFNMKYNISKLEIEKDKMKKLNLYLTIFTAPYIYLTPFDMFFK